MKTFLIESGLYNTSFLAIFLMFLCAMVGALPSYRWRYGIIATLILFVGTEANLVIAAYRAYVAPRDVMQDIVSAHEFLDGHPMYPDDMNLKMDKMLKEEGDRRGLSLGWVVGQYAEKSRSETVSQHWVQAHPPFMTLAISPMVAKFGILGTQIAISLIAILCFFWTWILLMHVFRLDWRTWQILFVMILAIGSSPLLTVIRNGQADLVLVALLTTVWYCVRSRRFNLAGIFLGLAVSLKMIPAILFVVMLARYRRTFVIGLITFLFNTILVRCIAAPEDLMAYQETARGVINEYASYPSNLSLLGNITRFLARFGIGLDVAKLIWMGLGAALMAGLFCLSWRTSRNDAIEPYTPPLEWDVIFSLSMALIPMCSPVAWDHYLAFMLVPTIIGFRLNGKLPYRLPMSAFLALVFLWLIPETAYLNIKSWLISVQLSWAAVWIVEPLRSIAVLFYAGWLSANAWVLVQARRKISLLSI
jgi:hypothetical protein